MWLALAAALVAAPASGRAPIIEKVAKLRRATFLDNRDTRWYLANAPFVDTPDPAIDDTFLYRIDLMTKHFVYGSPRDGYAVTEFIDKPEWSGTYGAIAAPLGLQFADLRWLRDQRVARDYARYWLHVPGAQPRRYTNWFGAAMWGLYEAWGDQSFIASMLPDMKAQYAGWQREKWDARYDMFVWDGMQDGMETNINSRQTDKKYYGDDAVRPTFSSYMYADARAIAAAARLAGDAKTAATFEARAAALKAGVQRLLWDPKRHFFFPMVANNQKAVGGGMIIAGSLTYQSGPYVGDPHGRELLGFVPWQFGLPDAGLEEAWRGIKDPDVFAARYGPTTTERHDPLFMITDNCCTWSGNSWPFATSQTLDAMATVLNEYRQTVVDRSDYYKLLRTYSLTQRRDGVPFVAEAANPDTGAWQITPGHSEHYFHSSYLDLVITGLAGLRPSGDDRLVVNPLIPNSWNWFALTEVPYHGRSVSIVWDRDGTHYRRGKGLSVLVDGTPVARRADIGKIDVPLRRVPPSLVDTSANYATNHEGSGFPKLTASFAAGKAPIRAAQDGIFWYGKAPANRWTDEGSAAKRADLGLDFGEAKRINSLRLYLLDDGAGEAIRLPTRLKVEQWANGRGWSAVSLKSAMGPLHSHAPTDIYFATALKTQRIKISLYHGAGNVGLSEVEAWGPAGQN